MNFLNKNAEMEKEHWISAKTISDRLGISVRSVRRLIEQGYFIVAKFNGSTRISETSFNKYVDDQVEAWKYNLDL